MSGQWETVGKKKEKGNQKIAAPQTVNKKKPENINVKVEDVLAKSQVKNLYANGKNKENKPAEVKKTADAAAKKVAKKPEKSAEAPKPKTPKSLESALKQLDANEFKSIFENRKSLFPEAPIVWLKDLAHFLNQRLNVDSQDPVFSQKPRNFPLSAVSPEIKSVMEKAIQEANKANVQLFFDISLTSMATDMSKNLPVLGHKLFLQYIALNEPTLVTASLAKHGILRSSYQNRPNIGLSIFWAVGHAGFNDFAAGLAIFQELMLPIVELKSYSRYIIQYLLDLVACNEEKPLTKDQLSLILDITFSNKKHFPADLKPKLISVIPDLKLSFCSASKKDTFKNSMEFFLKKLQTEGGDYEECLSDIIVEILSRDQGSMEHWTKIHRKYPQATVDVLRYIDKNWKTVSRKFDHEIFKETLKQIHDVIQPLWLKNKQSEELSTGLHYTKTLLGRMSGSSTAFKRLLIVSFIIGTFVCYDIKKEGSWQKSNTNQFLKQISISEYTDLIFDWIYQKWLWLDEQFQKTCPGCREFVLPYVTLVKGLTRISFNLYLKLLETIIEEYHHIVKTLNYQSPAFFEGPLVVVSNAWSTSVLYYNRSIDYLSKEVFVGQLSPENMQRVFYEALNVTQHKATECYHWLYEKVQTTIFSV